MEYRKRPVVIEAFQMTKERRASNADWPNWMHDAWALDITAPGSLQPLEYPNSDGTDELVIVTLEGNHLVSWGDWIIRGVKGELYPCKPDIFKLTYEAAEPGWRPLLKCMFADLRARVQDLGQARDVSIALTHLDTAEKWARDYGAQPATIATVEGKLVHVTDDGRYSRFAGEPSPGSKVSPAIDHSAYNRREDEAD